MIHRSSEDRLDEQEDTLRVIKSYEVIQYLLSFQTFRDRIFHQSMAHNGGLGGWGGL
jgi:hypothetical protein